MFLNQYIKLKSEVSVLQESPTSSRFCQEEPERKSIAVLLKYHLQMIYNRVGVKMAFLYTQIDGSR